jgi:hypothetical protein
MRRHLFLPTIVCMLFIGAGWPTYAENPLREAQLQNPSTTLVGTWRSGNFAFTFFDNGTYVYVGAIVTSGMQTRSSEKGTYLISGDTLITQRESGTLVTSQNYTQDLAPATTTYRWSLGRTQNGLALQLIYPNGGPQIFYKQ